MFKKVLVFLTLILFVSGCGVEDKEATNNTKQQEKNDKLVIKTKVTNKEEKGGYLIYFMHVGERDEELGKANQSALGPFETDENGEYVLDLNVNYSNDVGSYIDNFEGDDKNKLEMFVVTKEDVYIRNPLNEETIVEFVKNDNALIYVDPLYYSKEKELEVPFIDKYPDGVLSLTFQDATFVVKLEFSGEIPKKSYEVSIFWNDPTKPSGIGIIRVGRVCRSFQYWDTPFFKTDNLASKTGTIIINEFDTNKNVDYEGYPKTVSFDKDGNPIGDKTVKIKLK